MTKKSAGILAFRREERVEVFLVHPGGPFWKNKDAHAWSIPKGEFEDEEPLVAARREFEEETGQAIDGHFVPLEPLKRSGKHIYAFAIESSAPDASAIESNEFELEWPPGSGRMNTYPEVDRAAWVALEDVQARIHKGQWPLIEQLIELFDL